MFPDQVSDSLSSAMFPFEESQQPVPELVRSVQALVLESVESVLALVLESVESVLDRALFVLAVELNFILLVRQKIVLERESASEGQPGLVLVQVLQVLAAERVLVSVRAGYPETPEPGQDFIHHP